MKMGWGGVGVGVYRTLPSVGEVLHDRVIAPSDIISAIVVLSCDFSCSTVKIKLPGKLPNRTGRTLWHF